MLNKFFLKILWSRRRDYLLVVLSGIFIISMVFFSTAVAVSYTHLTLPTTSRV